MAYGGRGYQDDCYLQDVNRRTWKAVTKVVQSTWDVSKVGIGRDAEDLEHCGIKVTDVSRVDNRKLFRAYTRRRDHILDRMEYNPDLIRDIPPKLKYFNSEEREWEANELYLFHGTTDDAVENITSEGFDRDVTDPNAMYGQGIYFAEEFTKADQYTDDRFDRDPYGAEMTVLLCRVFMGEAYVCHKHNAKKRKAPPRGYNSVLGDGHGMLFREFVVYSKNQCYPEFVVTYKRLGRRRYVNEWE